MEIRLAGPGDLAAVRRVVQDTIAAIYPGYYPPKAVEFFQRHHSDEAILADLAEGRVWLLWDGETPCGTVTLKGSELARLFVLPEFQGRGFGRSLLAFAEARIGAEFGEIWLDASLPAKAIYLKRGYRPAEYHAMDVGGGQYLCYDVMRKKGKKNGNKKESGT